MSDLPELVEWTPGIYQLETSDPVLGGPDGIDNLQGKQLANRTRWLKDQIDKLVSGVTGVGKALRLATARTISITGAGTGGASFDGSADAAITLTLANSGAVAGTYPKVTVNAKGLVTAGAALGAADVPALDWGKITSGKPTTLGGYGITDAYTKTQSDTSVRSIMAQFGFGSVAANYTGNIDTLALDGIYMVSTSTTGTKPTIPGTSTAVSNGTIVHLERGSSSMATQMWDSLISEGASLAFWRTKTSAGIWTPWAQKLTSDSTATQTQVDAGTLDTVLVTPKTLRWGVLYSLGLNGYLFLPSWLGGIGFQWGYDTTNSTGTTHSYPMAFPNAVLQIIGSDRGIVTVENVSLENVSTAQYKARSSSAGTPGFAFIAIGR